MDAHDQKTQQQESRATADRRGSKSLISKDRNAPIRAVEKQLITAEHHALQDRACSRPHCLKETSSMQYETNEKLSFY